MTETQSPTLRAWALMNQLRSYERLTSGRRVAALAALGFLACLDPISARAWAEFRNRAVHYVDAHELGGRLFELSMQIEDQRPTLGRSFSAALAPDILQSGGHLPEFATVAASVVEAATGEPEKSFGQWFDAVLDLASQGRQVSEITTPRPLARLMARLANPSPGDTVLDPTCGMGATLIELTNLAPGLRLHGQEVGALAAALATVRLYLLDLPAEISLGDALRAPAQWSDTLTRFDRVICDPPYNLATQIDGDGALASRFSRLPTSRSEAFFVEHCLQNLAPEGRAVVLLPLGFLARRGGEAAYRADLLNRGRIEGAIALPGGVIPWTELPIAVVVLRGHDAPGEAIRLVDASYLKALGKRATERLTDEQVVEVTELYDGPISPGRACIVSPEDVLKQDADLQPQHWLAEEEAPKIDLGALYRQAVEAEARAEAAKADLDTLMVFFRLRAL